MYKHKSRPSLVPVLKQPKSYPGSSYFFQLQTWIQDVSIKLSEESPGITLSEEEEMSNS